jgi:hypothetical protein
MCWSAGDFAENESRVIQDEDAIELGEQRLQRLETPQLSQGQGACLFYGITSQRAAVAGTTR